MVCDVRITDFDWVMPNFATGWRLFDALFTNYDHFSAC